MGNFSGGRSRLAIAVAPCRDLGGREGGQTNWTMNQNVRPASMASSLSVAAGESMMGSWKGE